MSRHSKFLTLVLRHRPEVAGLTLDKQGWVSVDTLLQGLKEAGRPLNKGDLFNIVRDSDKKRFTLNEDKTRIRAAQGHTLPVDLGLTPKTPPDHLFHGTARQSLDSIFANGINPGKRQSVHLSSDVETAISVGSRHGKVAVLYVDTKRMHEDGHVFTQSDNGVWLTDTVPSVYLSFGAPRPA
jgi:putative RNA 2'-phosphotransferase